MNHPFELESIKDSVPQINLFIGKTILNKLHVATLTQTEHKPKVTVQEINVSFPSCKHRLTMEN